MRLPRIEGSFSAYISGLSLGITLLESHWFMPAVRFMRKNRAIESQHGSDLSRVGRNDTAKGREEGRDEDVIGMDWKKEAKQRNKWDAYWSTTETQVRFPRNIHVHVNSPWFALENRADRWLHRAIDHYLLYLSLARGNNSRDVELRPINSGCSRRICHKRRSRAFQRAAFSIVRNGKMLRSRYIRGKWWKMISFNICRAHGNGDTSAPVATLM